MIKRPVTIGLILLACLAFGAGTGFYTSGYYANETLTRPDIRGLLWPNPRGIGTFQLTDDQDRPFGREDLAGKWSMVFFGFTHCPDICPTTLTKMNRVYQQLDKQNREDKLQVLFVSVDPERDTPEKLAQYVDYFNRDFIGLGGSEEQVKSLTRQMGVVSTKTGGSSPGNYLVDHTASVFIIDPDVRWVGLLSTPHQVEDMQSRFTAIRDFIRQQG